MNLLENNTYYDRFRTPALVVGVVGLAACGIGAVTMTDTFFRTWLLGFVLWTMVSLGGLALMMIHNMTGGAWGVVIRRPLEAAARMIPLMLIAFIPVIIGMHSLYEWTHEDVVANDHILQQKAIYLNTPFFIGRGIAMFLLWTVIAYALVKWAREYEETGDGWVSLRARRLSAPGIVLLALTVTFASVDWMMSLEPHWFSTMYGLSFMVGCLLAAMTFIILVTIPLLRHEPFASLVDKVHLRDLGNLTLAFTMLWAYLSFSQFMLIWYGNLQEEVPYYLVRGKGGWGVIAAILIVLHFFLPFFLLLMRFIKHHVRSLAAVAGLLFLMRIVDLFWLIAPAFRHDFWIHWLHIASVVGIGGVWIYGFLTLLRKDPALPRRQEALGQEALSHG